MAVNQIYDPTEPTGRDTFSRKAPRYVDVRVLAASTNETHTVPAGAKYVVFASDDLFYAKANGAAAVPSADVTDGSGSEMNPGVWRLVADDENAAVTTIGLIAPRATTVTLTFHKD